MAIAQADMENFVSKPHAERLDPFLLARSQKFIAGCHPDYLDVYDGGRPDTSHYGIQSDVVNRAQYHGQFGKPVDVDRVWAARERVGYAYDPETKRRKVRVVAHFTNTLDRLSLVVFHDGVVVFTRGWVNAETAYQIRLDPNEDEIIPLDEANEIYRDHTGGVLWED